MGTVFRPTKALKVANIASNLSLIIKQTPYKVSDAKSESKQVLPWHPAAASQYVRLEEPPHSWPTSDAGSAASVAADSDSVQTGTPRHPWLPLRSSRTRLGQALLHLVLVWAMPLEKDGHSC